MNTYHVAGPGLIKTNVYGQLIAPQELMSSSKQPYGVDTVVIPIYRWSPALSRDSDVPKITQKTKQTAWGFTCTTCFSRVGCAAGFLLCTP